MLTIGGNRSAKVVDVTPYGAHLELSTALNPRGECLVAIPLPDGMIRVKARVVHCKLTGMSNKGPGGQIVYRAGLEFLGIDGRIAESIGRAFPETPEPDRAGPVKVRISDAALDRMLDDADREAN